MSDTQSISAKQPSSGGGAVIFQLRVILDCSQDPPAFAGDPENKKGSPELKINSEPTDYLCTSSNTLLSGYVKSRCAEGGNDS